MSKSKEKVMKPEFGKYPILISGGWNPLSTSAETFETPFVEMHEVAESLSVQITNKTAEKETSTTHISALGYLGCAKKVAESNESHFVPQSLNSLTTVGTPVPNIVHAMADSVGQFEYEGIMSYPKDPQVTSVRYLITALATLHGLDAHEAWNFTKSLVYDANGDSYRLPFTFSTNGGFAPLTTMHFQAIKNSFSGKPLKFNINTGGGGLSTVDFVVPEYPIPTNNVTAVNVVTYFANLFPTGINNQGYALCAEILGHFPDNPGLVNLLTQERVATQMTGHNVLVFSSIQISSIVGKIISGCSMTVRKYQQKLATRELLKFDPHGSVAQLGRYSLDRSRCYSYEKMTPVELCLVALCNYQGDTHWTAPRYESHEFNRMDVLRQYAEHSRLNK